MTERILFWALLALVAYAPLPFASNRPWSWSLLALLSGVLLAAWAVAAAFRRAPAPVALRRCWPVVLPFVLATGWAAVQASGWTPANLDHPAWAIAGAALDRPLDGALSVEPLAAWDGLMRLFGYAAVFWLALQLCRGRERARTALLVLVASVGIYALYGLIAQLSGSQSILWFRKWAYLDSVTGPFVNRNSFATYLGLGLLCATALLLEAWQRALEFAPGLRLRVKRSIEMLSGHGILLLLLAVVATALLLTGSRGGLAATVAGMAGLLLLSGGQRRGTIGLRSIALLIGAGAIALFLVSGEKTGARLGDAGGSLVARGDAYAVTARAIETAPLLGAGLGSFDLVFKLFQPIELTGNWGKAHESYLENALELGIPGAALLTLPILLAALHCLRGVFRRRRDGLYPAIAVAATLLVGSHALIDFSLQIPAVSVAYAFLLGLGSTQAWRRGDLAEPERDGGDLPG
ncbi:O-antigen ligase [Tistlia consotensis]|uniref:O-antigen ligase n=1 Tax=Tistlia consotensis USBA 355 TaxID=560819 RepID=A0A1Y6BPZ3_9PROT|nr:O-antigen ligase family protein [Tistlia consotensis]SMF21246.1 O-antigen ligase [Tistlia consotensis USBA 355]SNR47118.1 O-antigen ligase [Tistlia consotensis]